MIVFTIGDIISLVFISSIIILWVLAFIVSYIEGLYKEKSKKWHNCYECKYWKLYSVPSFGDGGTFVCKNEKNLEEFDKHIWRPSANDRYLYKKCKYYEEE